MCFCDKDCQSFLEFWTYIFATYLCIDICIPRMKTKGISFQTTSVHLHLLLVKKKTIFQVLSRQFWESPLSFHHFGNIQRWCRQRMLAPKMCFFRWHRRRWFRHWHWPACANLGLTHHRSKVEALWKATPEQKPCSLTPPELKGPGAVGMVFRVTWGGSISIISSSSITVWTTSLVMAKWPREAGLDLSFFSVCESPASQMCGANDFFDVTSLWIKLILFSKPGSSLTSLWIKLILFEKPGHPHQRG